MQRLCGIDILCMKESEVSLLYDGNESPARAYVELTMHCQRIQRQSATKSLCRRLNTVVQVGSTVSAELRTHSGATVRLCNLEHCCPFHRACVPSSHPKPAELWAKSMDGEQG